MVHPGSIISKSWSQNFKKQTVKVISFFNFFTIQLIILGCLEGKKQVIANLANFAYDPINYEHMYKLNVLDLFLDSLTESDPKLIEFAIGGLCNCCPGKGYPLCHSVT